MFSHRVLNAGFQMRSLSRDKHPRARAAERRGQDRKVLGTPDFPAWNPEWVSLEPASFVEENYALVKYPLLELSAAPSK